MNILPLAYLGNIQYLTKLLEGDYIIDIHEHYVKQSYRTRCDILTANGPTTLTVPVVNTGNWSKQAVKDVRIDSSKRWAHTHWQSIVSSYKGAPYFEHYADLFEPFFRPGTGFLLDLNLGLMQTILELLGQSRQLVLSDSYIDHAQATSHGYSDYRTSLSPKPRLHRPDPRYAPVRYWQVFSERHGFVPNLSAIDLLFCEGPGSIGIIRQSVTY